MIFWLLIIALVFLIVFGVLFVGGWLSAFGDERRRRKRGGMIR